MKLKEFLIKIIACEDAIEWVEERTIEQAIAECHRGDWMLRLAEELNIDKRKIVLTAGHCANSERHLMKDERSTYAVDAAIAYGEGRITENELKTARDAAFKVAAVAAAEAVALGYDRYAARAAFSAFSAANANYTFAARSENRLKCADICRKYIGDLIIESFNNQIT